MIVHDFSNKKLKKHYPDFNFKSYFIRNKSDLILKHCFLYAGHYCFVKQHRFQIFKSTKKGGCKIY